ncbi:MAG: CBS domain-containing protein [Planctomycetaceae bacterium]|nr:CBS domain-containing protein [Planctomycetaceae bacterium]
MLVRDVLHSKGGELFTIDPQATVQEAIAKMVQKNIGSLPVVDDDGRLIGLFAERDVLKTFHNRGDNCGRLPLSQVMIRNPQTCRSDDNVNDIMGQMTEKRAPKIPVVDGDKLVGIISVGDIVKVMYENVSTENRHLLSYIHGAV